MNTSKNGWRKRMDSFVWENGKIELQKDTLYEGWKKRRQEEKTKRKRKEWNEEWKN